MTYRPTLTDYRPTLSDWIGGVIIVMLFIVGCMVTP